MPLQRFEKYSEKRVEGGGGGLRVRPRDRGSVFRNFEIVGKAIFLKPF